MKKFALNSVIFFLGIGLLPLAAHASYGGGGGALKHHDDSTFESERNKGRKHPEENSGDQLTVKNRVSYPARKNFKGIGGDGVEGRSLADIVKGN